VVRGFASEGSARSGRARATLVSGAPGGPAGRPGEQELGEHEPGGPLDGDAHGHDGHDGHDVRVAWLLVLPLLTLMLVAPPPLGQFAVARQSAAPVVSSQPSYPPLPAEVGGAVPLAVGDFIVRALYDEERSLDGRSVRLTGFVSDTATPGQFTLSRFTLNCCAADARALNVTALTGPGEQPALDQWVDVVGTVVSAPVVRPGTVPDPPGLRVTAVTPVEQPDQPYEY